MIKKRLSFVISVLFLFILKVNAQQIYTLHVYFDVNVSELSTEELNKLATFMEDKKKSRKDCYFSLC